MVGALVVRNKLGVIISDVDKELGCDIYLEDIGIDVDMDSFHIDISRIIIEAGKETAQAVFDGLNGD